MWLAFCGSDLGVIAALQAPALVERMPHTKMYDAVFNSVLSVTAWKSRLRVVHACLPDLRSCTHIAHHCSLLRPDDARLCSPLQSVCQRRQWVSKGWAGKMSNPQPGGKTSSGGPFPQFRPMHRALNTLAWHILTYVLTCMSALPRCR